MWFENCFYNHTYLHWKYILNERVNHKALLNMFSNSDSNLASQSTQTEPSSAVYSSWNDASRVGGMMFCIARLSQWWNAPKAKCTNKRNVSVAL